MPPVAPSVPGSPCAAQNSAGLPITTSRVSLIFPFFRLKPPRVPMTTLFSTLDTQSAESKVLSPESQHSAPSTPNSALPPATGGTDIPVCHPKTTPLFPAYTTRIYICDDDWLYHLLIDRDLKTNQWEVDLAIWSPRWDIRRGPCQGRNPSYRFLRLPCADRPAAEQLALRLEAMIQRRLAGRPRQPTAPTPQPYRSLAEDF